MKSLEFIKQHVTEWPASIHGSMVTHVLLFSNGRAGFGSDDGESVDVYCGYDLSEHFAPDYCDGKVYTREEFESFGVAPPEQPVKFEDSHPNWDDAPSWATCYGFIGLRKQNVWYDSERYEYVRGRGEEFSFAYGSTFSYHEVTHISDRPSAAAPEGVDATVEERGNRYGAFKDGADIMQELKSVMRSTPNWNNLTPSQREALEMIQHKVGRILNGDPNYTDSWHDIKGYAHLIEEELNGNVK